MSDRRLDVDDPRAHEALRAASEARETAYAPYSRVALFNSVVKVAGKPEVLALVSRRTDGELTWPCGACLQVAMEA